jgi:hypothetical protein
MHVLEGPGRELRGKRSGYISELGYGDGELVDREMCGVPYAAATTHTLAFLEPFYTTARPSQFNGY